MLKYLFGAMLLLVSTTSYAQMVKTEETAANGVEVSVNSDDFAGRFEYTAPSIKFDEGFALVAVIKEGGKIDGPYIMGTIMYRDRTWRRYDKAILRGGEEVEAIFGDRDVVSCRGSRYSGCTYSEGFQLTLNSDQRKRLSEAKSIDIQLKGVPGSELILTVPASYFVAVEEVSAG